MNMQFIIKIKLNGISYSFDVDILIKSPNGENDKVMHYFLSQNSLYLT